MKKREHRPTSSSAHNSIKGHKGADYQKIISALEKLKVGGTYHEISRMAGMEPVQVGRRLSEMGDMIYNIGISRPLPTGRKGLVWQLKGQDIKKGDVPVIQTTKKKTKTTHPINQQPFL